MSSPISDTSAFRDVVEPTDTEREEEYVDKPILKVDIRIIIKKAAIYILLTGVYSFTYLAAVLGSILPRRSWKPTGRILVTGTFHNPGWYMSHVIPLSRSGVKEVILVIDEPQLPLERVRFVCPPRWASKFLGRAVTKAIWMIIAGLRYRPDLYMGYHLTPGACSALLAGKIMGRPSCYQMTGGPVELMGSGFNAIASIDKAFEKPCKILVRIAVCVIKQFDLVVVRGSRAKQFLAAHNIKGSVAIITGSVSRYQQLPQNDREIHLIFVGRLSPIKQVHQFIEIVDAIKRIMPNVRAAIVGDGPSMVDMKVYAGQLDLADNIEFLGKRQDVPALLARSKVFVLTSKSEGLSIAMAEAMAAGTVPVVADVGELGDLVADGVNGYLVKPNHIDEYTKKVLFLLQDHALRTQYYHKAIEAAGRHCDIEVISKKWQQHLRGVVSEASGVNTQKAMNRKL